MSRSQWLLAALLAVGLDAGAQTEVDADGFKRPLDHLEFNRELDRREFERSNLAIFRIYDPWERWNRRIYRFNRQLDEWLLLPVLRGYHRVTPQFVRSGVSNFFSNLGEIPTLLNSLLQGRARRSAETCSRLLLNTTLGIAGLWDPATRMGLPRQIEDFGQTLGSYGMGEGPYLVLPLFGPSNLRDAGGLVTDILTSNRVDYLGVASTSSAHPELLGLQIIDKRDNTPFRYGQMNSPFEYDQVRYIYTRARRVQIEE